MSTIPLGEDILLARHGSNIVKLRQDRRNRQTVAVLKNGDTDTASNQLAISVLTPVGSVSRGVEAYLNDETGVSRKQVRSLAKISLGVGAVTGALFGALLLIAYRVGGSEMIESLSTAYSMYPM